MNINNLSCIPLIYKIQDIFNSADISLFNDYINENINFPNILNSLILTRNEAIIYHLSQLSIPLIIEDNKTRSVITLIKLILNRDNLITYSLTDLIMQLENLVKYVSPFEFIIEENEDYLSYTSNLPFNINADNMVFSENNKELWFFSIHRPIKQYTLFYIFKAIRKQNTIRRLK